MDLQDQAQEVEQQQRDDAIARARGTPVQGNWRRLSARWCEGPACGVRIPEERRRAIPGVKFCVECQTRKEKEERSMR